MEKRRGQQREVDTTKARILRAHLARMAVMMREREREK